MTTGGWINMLLSVGAVTTLFVWCLYKVLMHNPDEKNPADVAYSPEQE